MTMAAYILGTAAVPAKTICSILSAKRFFGPCVTRLPFASTVPMSGFSRSSKKSLDRALFVCAEFALEHMEAIFFEEGVERCGVAFGWVGAPWYEFAR